MDKSGIAVAEFWTKMSPKADFERKINSIMQEARERLDRRKAMQGHFGTTTTSPLAETKKLAFGAPNT